MDLDGQWVIFRSNRVRGEAMAVNEKTGDIVQVTEGGYTGMLNVARRSMKLYFLLPCPARGRRQTPDGDLDAGRRGRSGKLFADSAAGTLKSADAYQRICGTTPPELGAGGDMALDGDENWVYFRVGREEAAKHLAPDAKIEKNFGPRNMGAGPSGIAAMNVHTGAIKYVVSVRFRSAIFRQTRGCRAKSSFAGKQAAKCRSAPGPSFPTAAVLDRFIPRASTNGCTHEAVISKDEVAIAIMGHRQIPGGAVDVGTGHRSLGGKSRSRSRVGARRDTRKTDRPCHRQPSNA